MYLLTRILGCRHLLFVLLLLAFFILFPVLTVHGAQPADFNDDERDDFSTTAAAKPLSTNTELLTTEISLPDSADPATTTTESSTSGLSAPPPPLSLSPPLSSAETVGSCPTIAGFDLAFINRTTSKLLSLANSAAEEADEVCEVDRLLDQLLPPGYEPAVNFDLGQAIRVEHINQTLATADRLLTLISNYSQTFAPLNTRVLNRFSYLLLGLPLSSKCMSSLLAISGAIRRRELWAMKFLDATGKPPAGVLDGVFSAVGDYRQCLSIQSPSPPFSSRSVKAKESSSSEGRLPSFGGQYCWLAPVLPHPPRNSYRRGDRLGSVGSVNVPTSMVDELVEVLYLVNGSLFQLGLCLPTTCSAGEVELALNTILYPILHIPLKVGPQCSTAEQSQQWGPLDGYQKMAIITIGSLFALTLVASLVESFVIDESSGSSPKNEDNEGKQVSIKMSDLNNNNNNGSTTAEIALSNKSVQQSSSSPSSAKHHQHSLPLRLLFAFSLVGNTRAMFRVSPNKFAAIDCLRFLMLVQIIWMHQYYTALGWSALPLTKRLVGGLHQLTGTATKYMLLRNTHNTDFFFALTGLLLTYSTLRNLERSKGRFNYLSFALNIYLRFYPAVFGVILFYYLLPLMADGPFWSRLDKFHVEACRRTLMESMLTYNFYTLDVETLYHYSMCNMSSWWVNSAFHLILLSPVLILPLYHFGANALWLVGVTILGGGAASAGHIWLKGVPYMNQVGRMTAILEEAFYSIFYTWPAHHHLGPFAAGILVGYLIRKHPKIYLGGSIGETILSVVFVGLSCLGFYWTQDMLKSPESPSGGSEGGSGAGGLAAAALSPGSSDLEVYLNVSFGKLMFVAGFLWIFYLCCTNRSAWLNRLFSCSTLQPLYSLSLGLYLTNFIPPLFTIFSSHELIEFTDFYIVKNLTFNFTLTVILSYILHVLFEKPAMNVLKIIESG